jgi:iron complex outermembrane recepter protein
VKKLFYCIVFIYLVSSGIYAQNTDTLFLKIIDDHGAPISEALVKLDFSSEFQYTNNIGIARIPTTLGKHRLDLFHLMFKDTTIFIEMDSNVSNIEVVMNSKDFVFNTVEVISTWLQENDPFTSSNFDKKEWNRINTGQDVPFMLQWSPSVVASSDAGAGIGYTGMSIRGSDPTRINISINGVPVNDSESQGVFWVNMPDFSSSVDGVQIQRGVGSSTNGSVAFGGTVNMSTQFLRRESYASILGGFGSFGTRRYSAQLGTGLLREKYIFEGRVSGISSNGYVDRASSDLSSWFFKAGYLGRKSVFKIIAFSGREITYQAWNGLPFQYISNPILRTYNPSGLKSDGTFYENEVDNYRQTHLHLIHQYAFSKNWTINTTFHYTRGYGYFEQFRNQDRLSRYKLDNIIIGDTTLSRSDLIRRRWLDNHFGGLIINSQYEVNRHRVNAGVSYNVYAGDHFGKVIWMQFAGNSNYDHNYYFNNALKSDASGFVKYSFQLHPNLSYFTDLQIRSVYYKYVGDNNAGIQFNGKEQLLFFNPKTGVYFTDHIHHQAYASFAVGSREPNRDDFTNTTELSMPNPEFLYNTELGYKYSNSKWQWQTNYYLMYYKDQLALTGRINDVGAFTRVNVPVSYRTGIESSVAVDYNRIFGQFAFTLSSNKIIQFTEYIDDWDNGGQIPIIHNNTDLALSPNEIGHIMVGLRPINFKIRSFDFKPECIVMSKYVGSQFLDNTSNPNSKLDAYSFTDLRIHVPIFYKGMKRLECRFSINNLFNALYVSNGWNYRYQSLEYNPVPDNPYSRSESNGIYNDTGLFPQAGRNWLFSLEWIF